MRTEAAEAVASSALRALRGHLGDRAVERACFAALAASLPMTDAASEVNRPAFAVAAMAVAVVVEVTVMVVTMGWEGRREKPEEDVGEWTDIRQEAARRSGLRRTIAGRGEQTDGGGRRGGGGGGGGGFEGGRGEGQEEWGEEYFGAGGRRRRPVERARATRSGWRQAAERGHVSEMWGVVDADGSYIALFQSDPPCRRQHEEVGPQCVHGLAQ